MKNTENQHELISPPSYVRPMTQEERKQAFLFCQKEFDRTGKRKNEPGAKLDGGKNRLGLVLGDFARALQAVGEVGTFGAAKYSDGGWKEVPSGVERYTDALYRHLLAEAAGEKLDADSGLAHAACVAWNAIARLDLILRQQEKASFSDPKAFTRQKNQLTDLSP